MRINMEKLEQYLKEGMILEFNSDKECMEYLNTCDYQEFESIEEMKKYQGRFGFNVGEKRYHINYEEALDVWNYNLGIEETFTDEEMNILSDGILALISNTNQALQLLASDATCVESLKKLTQKYKDLNDKICRMME